MLVDATGTVIQVNEAFEVMFEAPRVRVLGRHLDDLLAQARADGVEILDAEGEPVETSDHPVLLTLETGPAFGRVSSTACGGRVSPHCGSGRRPRPYGARDGTITGAIASFSDVTALRKSTAELHREERFLQVLLDTLGGGHRRLRCGGPDHRVQSGRP